jgi:hypothetical protein
MPMSREESIELRHLYDRFSLAVERASATMHMRGMDSVAFRVEDGKCVALWNHIRDLMAKANEPAAPESPATAKPAALPSAISRN